jgi:CBS domain-containing protein
MRVKDVMTAEPACCTPDARLPEVAQLMADCDCGEIPVVDSRETFKPIGVVTDRDITVRVVARGLNPVDVAVRDCMSTPVVTVTPEQDIEDCRQLMEDHQIRRVPVVDDTGRCCGIVAQADVARVSSTRETGSLVKEVSEPAGAVP